MAAYSMVYMFRECLLLLLQSVSPGTLSQRSVLPSVRCASTSASQRTISCAGQMRTCVCLLEPASWGLTTLNHSSSTWTCRWDTALITALIARQNVSYRAEWLPKAISVRPQWWLDQQWSQNNETPVPQLSLLTKIARINSHFVFSHQSLIVPFTVGLLNKNRFGDCLATHY